MVQNGVDVMEDVPLRDGAVAVAGKAVFLVLRFPVAVGEVIEVHESSVHDYRRPGALDAIFGNEGQRAAWPCARTSLAGLGTRCGPHLRGQCRAVQIGGGYRSRP